MILVVECWNLEVLPILRLSFYSFFPWFDANKSILLCFIFFPIIGINDLVSKHEAKRSGIVHCFFFPFRIRDLKNFKWFCGYIFICLHLSWFQSWLRSLTLLFGHNWWAIVTINNLMVNMICCHTVIPLCKKNLMNHLKFPECF